MEMYKRRQAIVVLVKEQGEVSVEDLAARFGVSANTVRTDLNALAEEGLLHRVHRGAVSPESQTTHSKVFATRANINRTAKERMGQWAASLVKDGEAIVLDASSTVFSLSMFLRDRRDLTVVTNGLEVALLLAQNPSNKVILAADTVRSDGLSLIGNLNPALLNGFYASKCFVSCLGFSLEQGLTEVDVDETPLKARMLKLAQQVIALVDSSKFGKVGVSRFAELTQIDWLVTDDGITPEYLASLRQAIKIPVTLVGAATTETFLPLSPASPGHRYRLDLGQLTEKAGLVQQLRISLALAAEKLQEIERIVANGSLDSPGGRLQVAELMADEVGLALEFQLEAQVENNLVEKLNWAGIPVKMVE